MGQAKPSAPAYGRPHAIHPGWGEHTQTLSLPCGETIRLRPLYYQDGVLWREQRMTDQYSLQEVEPTSVHSWAQTHSHSGWREYFFNAKQSADSGFLVPLVIEVSGEFAGQIVLGNIQHGTTSDCWVGYWVYSAYRGRGIATAACALATDHAFSRVGLHRVYATYLPGNIASQAVLENNGFRSEGLLRQNLHINGQWRDHVLSAQTSQDYPDTCVERLISAGRAAAWQ
ncbi:N-acetyltransferase [Corynebacterium sp. sy017]|uniref:GNAT family N-acetyltransferase n=1 Tax=unclassified Corynebacterium TaxID=2624378 RepID=UPI001185C967|nr:MULTISPECIES: GNAT family protein [unclassified Corynebacterium]MBP3088860.1 N-acetyltransferase [Corynebacterium sp. sy017]TSD91202.1 N-acetyltransferase [Corynebacterium sp. SY003]